VSLPTGAFTVPVHAVVVQPITVAVPGVTATDADCVEPEMYAGARRRTAVLAVGSVMEKVTAAVAADGVRGTVAVPVCVCPPLQAANAKATVSASA
jgi:hypothetical protein